jgi:hypothetical protein
MGKLWKTIGTVVPGPAVLLAGKWINLFSATHLTYPDWQEGADLIALAIAAVVAVVLSIALKDASKALIWIGLVLVLAGLATCWSIWFHLGTPMQAVDASWFQNVWQGVYIVTMVVLVATITVSALSLRKDKPKAFWMLAVSSSYWLLRARSGSLGGGRPARDGNVRSLLQAPNLCLLGGPFRRGLLLGSRLRGQRSGRRWTCGRDLS